MTGPGLTFSLRMLVSMLAIVATAGFTVACDGAASVDSDAGAGGRDAGIVSGADAGTASGRLTGWISVIETNDTCNQWYLKHDWYGGVRAHFAESIEHQRALAHHTDFLKKVETKGSCTLYGSDLLPEDAEDLHGMEAFGYIDYDCDDPGDAAGSSWCGPDAQCTRTADDDKVGLGVCVDLPDHTNLGDIALTGLADDVTLQPDELDRYSPTASYPADLFDADDTIKATTGGGAYDVFSLETRGVSHLELGNSGVLDVADGNYTVSWTPADDHARVEVAIFSGAHDPNPIVGMILCDVPDSAGEVTIPKEFMDELQLLHWAFFQKCNSVTRYSRATTTRTGGEIELFVGSARNLRLILPDAPFE